MTMVGIPVSDAYRAMVSALAETSIGRLTRTRGDQVEGAASQLERRGSEPTLTAYHIRQQSAVKRIEIFLPLSLPSPICIQTH